MTALAALRRLTVALATAAACSETPNSGDGQGPTSDDSSTGGEDSTSDGDGTTASSANSSGAVFTATVLTAADDDTSTTAPGSARLVYPGGNPLDLLFEQLGSTDIAAIELLNVGTAPATAIAPARALVPPFAFTADSFPGALGNCTDTLEAGEMCSFHVAFTPLSLGPLEASIALAYDGGDETVAVLQLLAEGRGTTDNLVQDGGAERCGEGGDPAGWDQGAAVHWTCTMDAGDVTPHGGATMLAVSLPDDATFSMTHAIDLGAHTAGIEQRQVTGIFSVWTRSLDADQAGIALAYLDAAGRTIETFDPAPQTGPVWTETADERLVPANAVTAEITIRCLPQAGECDLYVDDVALTLMR